MNSFCWVQRINFCQFCYFSHTHVRCGQRTHLATPKFCLAPGPALPTTLLKIKFNNNLLGIAPCSGLLLNRDDFFQRQKAAFRFVLFRWLPLSFANVSRFFLSDEVLPAKEKEAIVYELFRQGTASLKFYTYIEEEKNFFSFLIFFS